MKRVILLDQPMPTRNVIEEAVRRSEMLDQIQPDPDQVVAFRERFDLTTEFMAERIGLEPHQYAALEDGTRRLSPPQARKLMELVAEYVPPEPAA